MSDPEFPRVSRRTTLKWMAAASVPSVNGISAAKPGATGYGPDPDLIKIYKPGDLWPLTFSDHQRKTVIVLCDIIMPADESSPSASSLGVHDFVDEWISSPYPDQKSDRNVILKGLDWLDKKDFLSLSDDEQLKICEELAILAKKDRRKFPGSFFRRIRDLIAGGYYTTPEGMKDIGYMGNVAMPEWNGPPPEVLEKLGLESQE